MQVKLSDEAFSRALQIARAQGELQGQRQLALRLLGVGNEAIFLSQIEHARDIGGEVLAWGVAFGLAWHRRVWASQLEPGDAERRARERVFHEELAALVAPRQSASPGARLARRVLRVWSAAQQAWSAGE